MDCITISTFRSLEQQAIRQSREEMKRDSIHKVAIHLMETFRQDPNDNIITKPTKSENNTSSPTNINYYA